MNDCEHDVSMFKNEAQLQSFFDESMMNKKDTPHKNELTVKPIENKRKNSTEYSSRWMDEK